MKTMRPEWRKELRVINARVRQIVRDDKRDEKAIQKRIEAERIAFRRLVRGRVVAMSNLRKRQQILLGRLSS